MPTEFYNADSHIPYLTDYNGITFALDGQADGDSFLATYDNDALSTIVGASGDVQFSQVVASLGTVTRTGQWGAASNKILNKVFKDQQKGKPPQKLEFKRISEDENVLVMTCSRCGIQKIPDYTVGVTAQNRAWAFKLEKMSFEEVQDPV